MVEDKKLLHHFWFIDTFSLLILIIFILVPLMYTASNIYILQVPLVIHVSSLSPNVVLKNFISLGN